MESKTSREKKRRESTKAKLEEKRELRRLKEKEELWTDIFLDFALGASIPEEKRLEKEYITHASLMTDEILTEIEERWGGVEE